LSHLTNDPHVVSSSHPAWHHFTPLIVFSFHHTWLQLIRFHLAHHTHHSFFPICIIVNLSSCTFTHPIICRCIIASSFSGGSFFVIPTSSSFIHPTSITIHLGVLSPLPHIRLGSIGHHNPIHSSLPQAPRKPPFSNTPRAPSQFPPKATRRIQAGPIFSFPWRVLSIPRFPSSQPPRFLQFHSSPIHCNSPNISRSKPTPDFIFTNFHSPDKPYHHGATISSFYIPSHKNVAFSKQQTAARTHTKGLGTEGGLFSTRLVARFPVFPAQFRGPRPQRQQPPQPEGFSPNICRPS